VWVLIELKKQSVNL